MQILHERRLLENNSAGKDLGLIREGRAAGAWCAAEKTCQHLCHIVSRTLGDPAVSQTLFPKLAGRYDFKIRILYISKRFFEGVSCW